MIDYIKVYAWTKCTDPSQSDLTSDFCSRAGVVTDASNWGGPGDYGDVDFGGQAPLGSWWRNNKNWREIYGILTTNPVTSLAWQEEDIDTAQFGVALFTREDSGFFTACYKVKVEIYRSTGMSVYKPSADGSYLGCSLQPAEGDTYDYLSDDDEDTYIYANYRGGTNFWCSSVLVERKVNTYPSNDTARVSSIRRIYHPGLYRMELALGELGFEVDVSEVGMRKIPDEVEEPEIPSEDEQPAAVPVGKELTPEDWTEIIKQQQASDWYKSVTTPPPTVSTKTTALDQMPTFKPSPSDKTIPISSKKKFTVTLANGSVTTVQADNLSTAKWLAWESFERWGIKVISVVEG